MSPNMLAWKDRSVETILAMNPVHEHASKQVVVASGLGASSLTKDRDRASAPAASVRIALSNWAADDRRPSATCFFNPSYCDWSIAFHLPPCYRHAMAICQQRDLATILPQLQGVENLARLGGTQSQPLLPVPHAESEQSELRHLDFVTANRV